MKVCPVCGTSYEGKETFCPKDGSRLEERVAPSGKLVGEVLQDSVKLERLEFVDRMGERYTGRLTDTKRGVYVTVFNQNFLPKPGAQKLVETARAQVGNPLPEQLSALLRLNFETEPQFVVETAPAGPSIRALLQEQQRLSWQTAVRIACNVARIIDWLASHGVAHHGLHPGSIFVTDLKKGAVQLGEWYSEDAQWVENPMQVLSAQAPEFVGYVAYMAPELAENSAAADLRSAVYALGVLLYEMIIGKPPFVDARGAEVLRQHIHEQPVRVSIARGGGEVHSDLDHILEMMLSKEPDARFQAPSAIVAALSNLLDEDPMTVAPMIERADKQIDDDIFQTIEMSSVDRNAVPGLKSPKKDGLTGRSSSTAQNPVAKAELKKGAQTGSAPTVEVDQELYSESGEKKTLAMSNIGAALEEEARRQAQATGANAPSETDDAKPMATLMMGSSPFAETPESGLGEGSEVVIPKKVPAKRSKSGKRKKDRRKSGESKSVVVQPQTKEDSKPTVEVTMPPEPVKPAAADSTQPMDTAAKAEIAQDTSTAKEPLPTASDSSDALDSPSRSGTLELQREAWFTGGSSDDEDLWESSLAAHDHERSEQRNKFTKIGLVVLLGVAFVGALVYFEYFSGEPAVEAEVENTVPAEPEKPKANLDAVTTQFDTALEQGRLIAPTGNSALGYLERLKREAPEDAAYQTRRAKFVEAVRAGAKKSDEAGDLMKARALAGYGSQFAPDDEELKTMTADLQARFIGETTKQPDLGVADAGADLAAADEPDLGTAPEVAEVVEPEEVPEEAPPKKITKTPKPSSKPAAKPDPKPDPVKSAAEGRRLAKEARSAYSRGDLSKALGLYEEALDNDSGNHQIHAGIGQVYFDQAKYDQAVRHQSRAVKLNGGRLDYRISLGQSYYRLGRYKDAIAVWEAVLKKDPNNKNAKQYIGLAKRKLN